MFNAFRILADLCHLSSKGILITTVHLHRSAEGFPPLLPASSPPTPPPISWDRD